MTPKSILITGCSSGIGHDAAHNLATRGWRESRFEGSEAIGVAAAREAATAREGDGAGDFRVETDAGESGPRGGVAMSLGAGLGIDDFDGCIHDERPVID